MSKEVPKFLFDGRSNENTESKQMRKTQLELLGFEHKSAKHEPNLISPRYITMEVLSK